jgi:hypothetical protein
MGTVLIAALPKVVYHRVLAKPVAGWWQISHQPAASRDHCLRTATQLNRKKCVHMKRAFIRTAYWQSLTYEIMSPAAVGVPRNQIVLGKHSGRSALAHRLRELGVVPETYDLDLAYRRFVELADRKNSVFDQDLLALISTVKSRTADAHLREALC